MVVKNNLTATNTLNTLNANSSELAKSLKKVSSGMRINGAGDDSANFSISEKMRVKIRAMEQDARNLQGGISLVKVGLGGMEQIKSSMESMKELALGAANDTMTDIDRATSQKVIDQLIQNIDDVAVDTTFNDIHVLLAPNKGGSTNSKVDVVFVVDITGSMGPIISRVADELGGFASALRSMGKDFRFGLVEYGDIREAGVGDVTKKSDFTEDEVEFEGALRGLSTRGGDDEPESGLDGIMDDVEGAMSFPFREDADKHIVVITDASTLDADDTAATGLMSPSATDPGTSYHLSDVVDAATEKGIIIDVVGKLSDVTMGSVTYPRRSDWTVIQEGTGGLYFDIDGDFGRELMALAESFGEVFAQAPLRIHDGTKANQNIMINLYDHRAMSFGIDPLSINPRSDAEGALEKIDKALDKILDRTTTYGSYINRMEAAFDNVVTGTENTQASESVIRDADMAKEMTTYVKNNVLSQTAQSMLAQANQNLGSVLSLLQ